MPIFKVEIPEKNKPTNSSNLQLQTCGLVNPTPQIYLYADVLEELFFCARKQNSASCLLTGGWFMDPDGTEFIEIDAFQDLLPVENSLNYATHFLKNGYALKSYPNEKLLGTCHLRPDSLAKATAEDVIFHNSYFGYPYHTTLIIDGKNDKMCFYQLNKEAEFVDIGFFLISAAK